MQFINRWRCVQLSSSFIWFVAVPLSPFRFIAVSVVVLTIFVAVLVFRRVGLSPLWMSPFWICRCFDLSPFRPVSVELTLTTATVTAFLSSMLVTNSKHQLNTPLQLHYLHMKSIVAVRCLYTVACHTFSSENFEKLCDVYIRCRHIVFLPRKHTSRSAMTVYVNIFWRDNSLHFIANNFLVVIIWIIKQIFQYIYWNKFTLLLLGAPYLS